MAKSSIALLEDEDEDEDPRTSEEAVKFLDYYESVVSDEKPEMSLSQFMEYPNVVELLENGAIGWADAEDLWLSSAGDADTLNAEEAFELLIMVSHLPDPDDIDFYNAEYEKLSEGKEGIDFKDFLGWDDVQAIVEEEALTEEEIKEIWVDVIGKPKTRINRDSFGLLNRAIDDAIEDKASELYDDEFDEVDDGKDDDLEEDDDFLFEDTDTKTEINKLKPTK